MRFIMMIALIATMIIFSACGSMESRPGTAREEKAPASEPMVSDAAKAESGLTQGHLAAEKTKTAQDSMVTVSQVQSSVEPVDRKIIRNGELNIEIDSPTDGQRKITSIAESHGGFVVTSEFRQQDNRGQVKPNETVTVVVRVPASQFGPMLEQIRSVGSRVIQEKVAGQDVTEEYIDLEARIRTKKALEAQFMEIMKQAKKVSEALEVQSQIAEVRTEIERLEGRRRFLENQSAMSTITITLQTPAPLVTATTSGFGNDIKRAFGDGIDVGAAIILGLIRFLIVMVPVGILILLPAGLLIRYFIRRLRLTEKAQPASEVQ